MNIFLVPYTLSRHFMVGLVCAGAAILAWWLTLTLTVTHQTWDPKWDGTLFFGIIASVVTAASVLAEGTLRRNPWYKRVFFTGIAFAGTFGMIVLTQAVMRMLRGALLSPDNADITLTTLRFRILDWAVTGLVTGMIPIPIRRFKGFFAQLAGGLAAGLGGAATWHFAGYPLFDFLTNTDLYFASAAGATMFGFLYGTLTWGVPDELYAGWLRVVTETRHGRRIPVDTHGTTTRERFVGHFPRGLDLFLPANDGVMELHVSVLHAPNRTYRARGLTLQPTVIRRFLERVDIRYDARRPFPLEAPLRSGDRIVLGPPGNQTVVEFVMLPREEQ